MALPLVRVKRHGSVDLRRFPPMTPAQITTLGGLADVVGRAFAISFGVGTLLAAGSEAASLAVIGVLALGSALVSWSE